jgi:hypothetical protein
MFRQAQAVRGAKEASWRVLARAKQHIAERILDGSKLLDGLDPELASLLARINWMVVTASLYTYREAHWVFTDLAPEVLQLLAVFQEMTVYVDRNWDSLPDGPRKLRTDRQRVLEDAAYVNGEIAKLKAKLEMSNSLTVHTNWFLSMRELGVTFFCLMFGEDQTRQFLVSMSRALEHLRTHAKVAQISEDMPIPSGQPS